MAPLLATPAPESSDSAGKCPAPHAVQADAPAAEYVPAVQLEHVSAPSAEEVPAMHCVLAVCVQECPAGHVAQLSCPVLGW